MKKRLNNLLKSGKCDGRPYVIWGNTYAAYEALKVLANNQIRVQGIITYEQDVRRNKKIYGINLYTFDQFKVMFAENANLLIEKAEYNIWGELLTRNNYKINKNLFVDFGLLKGKDFIKFNNRQFWYLIKGIPTEYKNRIRKGKDKCRILGNYIKEFTYIYKGMGVYNRIRKECGNEADILVYDYSGLGDVFILSGLLAGNGEKINNGNFILTVIGNASKKVAEMFKLQYVISLKDEESLELAHFTKFMGEKCGLYSITPFSRVMYTEKISNSLAGYKINMLDMYKYLFFHLEEEDDFCYPIIFKVEESIEEIFYKNKLEKGNTVILSPYANTVIGYPIGFWTELGQSLLKRGFCVCTNCSGEEKEIPGTVRLSFGLEIAEAVLDYAGYFIALRNGFCDIVSNSLAKKIIIYPIYSIFNSNVYEFCSFEKMRIGRNYVEMQWNYENLEELEKIVLRKLI